MKKIIALIEKFDQAEAVTDYAMRLAYDSGKALEIIHFLYQGQFFLDKRAHKNSPVPVKLVENTEALIKKRTRILGKIISVKQASVDLPRKLNFAVKHISVYQLIRTLNEREDIEEVVFAINNTSKNETILNDLKEHLVHPLNVFKIENV